MAEVEEKQAKPKHDETPLEAFASICGVLAVGLFVLTFVFQNFAIPSSSMVKALLVGDHVLVDRITLAPPAAWAPFVYYRNVRHGDIIVFYKPTLEPNGEHLFLVKRVIGLPGDHIHLRDGIVYRNGVALRRTVCGRSRPTSGLQPLSRRLPVGASVDQRRCDGGVGRGAAAAIFRGRIWWCRRECISAMGDNRTVSLDSRYWGFVPRANIVGRPLFVYWSFDTPESQEFKTSLADRVGWILHETIHFFDGTRWRRTLHRVK